MPDGPPAGTDTVLDELEVLLTVEHALIVEYLTLQYASVLRSCRRRRSASPRARCSR